MKVFFHSSKTLGAIALSLPLIVLTACSNANEPEVNTSDAATENVTTEDVATDGEELATLVGRTVTIRQEIDETVGDSAFLMDDEQLFGGEEILVLNASGAGVDLVEGDDTDLQVTGEVVQFVRADVEAEYGISLDPDLFVDYENRPAIIAQSIALAPDPDDVNDDPSSYYGRRIAVNGEVETVFDAKTMTLDEDELFGGPDLLVISPDGTLLEYEDDEELVITGVLQPLIVSEFEQDYDLTWDLDLQSQIEAEYSDRPVLIADSVYPSAL